MLLPTLVLKIGSKKSVISQPHDIQMLTVFDPCKALASLPSPLIATETLELKNDFGIQSVKLTAGLHRQTWVSGNSIFADVHIVNNSQRILRKLELQLQRSTLWYAHAAAGIGDKNANHLRLPKRQENDIINFAVVRKSRDWSATPPNTSEVRTCHIQVPQGHVTISTGRFFEVRYFLNVIVTVTMFKNVTVQLPITLIHMNSLDIVPNALAQVAASIEAKRSKTLTNNTIHGQHQPYYQGQAFVAPQKLSLELSRAAYHAKSGAECDGLKKELNRSLCNTEDNQQFDRSAKAVTMKQSLTPRAEMNSSPHCHRKHGSECYHCHLLQVEHGKRPQTSNSQAGPTLPRLQVSTSGLGFTESELSDFSAQNPPQRKVMLSEQERKMIRQQRELQHRSEWTAMQRRASAIDSRRNSKRELNRASIMPDTHALLEQQIRRAEPHVLDPRPHRRRSKTIEFPLQKGLSTEIQRTTSSGRRRANSGSEICRSDARNPTSNNVSSQCRLSSRHRENAS